MGLLPQDAGSPSAVAKVRIMLIAVTNSCDVLLTGWSPGNSELCIATADLQVDLYFKTANQCLLQAILN